MQEKVKVLFASASPDLIPEAAARLRAMFPELDLYAVSEFPVDGAHWIPYRPARGLAANLALCRASLAGKQVRIAAVILQPAVPFRRLRLIGFLISPWYFLAFNEHFGHFMLRPRALPSIARHLFWRTGNLLRWRLRRLRRPANLGFHASKFLAAIAGEASALLRSVPRGRGPQIVPRSFPVGLSVVIPSRDGKDLLARLLPGMLDQLQAFPSETIVVDNGSSDGTLEFLRETFPSVVVETRHDPMPFAAAVNAGIGRAKYSRVCLLNNDMVLEDRFFESLLAAFDRVPGLFCASAQIFFPEGVRREETGITILDPSAEDFPVRCREPLPGEDLTWVLYGSGGCSLFDAAKLAELGGFDEAYTPAYVEDLDLGVRAWRRGWPSVFVSGARVLHRHRATTSRYFSEEQVARVWETNYQRFLARSVCDRRIFRSLGREAIQRLQDRQALARARRIAFERGLPSGAALDDASIFALNGGSVSVFPGRAPSQRPRVLIVTPYLPFPLAHGGAVRMFNLMREAARDFDLVLISFVDEPKPAPGELLEFCCEIVHVKRHGSHRLPASERPDVVEEFDSAPFHAALRQTVKKWNPCIAQLEFTQMAQYAGDCAPAKTLLVEHDITLDLYEQLLAGATDPGERWETARQLERWKTFERAAWSEVDRVVTMSNKDAAVVGRNAASIANGVDLERFQPRETEPEAARLLFIGSFAHLPNLLAVNFFLREAWPHLRGMKLHIVAGARHEFFLTHYRNRVHVNLADPAIEVEGFVSDVRPAYERAAVVIAPLLASAGTNIKIIEAMAMGKAIVSTPGGINGLDLVSGRDLLVAGRGEEFAAAIRNLVENPERRRALEGQARKTAEEKYDWRTIGLAQKALYEELADPKMA